MPQRNSSVDIAKFIAAIFVIGIHTRPLLQWSGLADFVLCDIIFRTAVPFFAVCTGYYLTKRINTEESVPNWLPIKSMLLKTMLLYVVWSLFFLIVLAISWHQTGLLTQASFIGWFKSFLIGTPYYHLWYLAQLFWALVFFFIIVRFVPRVYKVVMTILLWLLGSYAYVYSDIIGLGREIVSFYDSFGSISGSLGRMLPLLLTGNMIAEKSSQNQRYDLALMFVSFIGLIVEVFLLRQLGAERYSYVIFTLPLAYFLFIIIERLPYQVGYNTKLLSKTSMNIYLLHPAVIVILKSLNVTNNMVLFCLALIITSVLCFAYEFLLILRKTS